MISDVALSSVVQSSYALLLFAICLYDHGLSLRNLPAFVKCGGDDHHQGDSDSDGESGVEAAGLGHIWHCIVLRELDAGFLRAAMQDAFIPQPIRVMEG